MANYYGFFFVSRCFEDGEVLMCDWKTCPKVYHLGCLGNLFFYVKLKIIIFEINNYTFFREINNYNFFREIKNYNFFREIKNYLETKQGHRLLENGH